MKTRSSRRSSGSGEWESIRGHPCDDEPPTTTSDDQIACERLCIPLLGGETTTPKLYREEHVKELQRAIRGLSGRFVTLDASQCWFAFWITRPLQLLGVELDADDTRRLVQFVGSCQHENGGFGGGPGQLPHLAPTYAAVGALVSAGGAEAVDCVDRQKMLEFLLTLKDPETGSFCMHDGGESDMRANYCAIATASMLHLLTPDLKRGVGESIKRCQRWDGGIAAEEGGESHGGYAYCGLAAMVILGESHKLDLHRLLDWAVNRQMSLEGGFQGRTAKLVDSCYSFWLGALFPLLRYAISQLGESEKALLPSDNYWFDSDALERYVFLCCQQDKGLLKDKPGKSPDLYHTCYSLSGTSIAQHLPHRDASTDTPKERRLRRTECLYNLCPSRLEEWRQAMLKNPFVDVLTQQAGHPGVVMLLED